MIFNQNLKSFVFRPRIRACVLGAVPLPGSEEPTQVVSQPVVQGQASAQPGFGSTLTVPPTEPEAEEATTIVLTPQPEDGAPVEDENGVE